MEPNCQTLEITIPGPDAPGFLRRQRTCKELVDMVRGRDAQGKPVSSTAADMDRLIDFLLQFVSVPADRQGARELLLDMPRQQYFDVLSAVMQEDASFLSPMTSVSSSSAGTSAEPI